MKTHSALLLLAIGLISAVMMSCSKEEPALSGQENTAMVKAAGVFVVSPTGNYTGDAAGIRAALNSAITAGPGATVQLTEGTFYLDERLEIEGFDGYFKGAGRDKTLLTMHDPVPYDVSGGDIHALLKFRHGNLRMSDLSFDIPLAEPSTGGDFGTALYALVMVTGSSLVSPSPAEQQASASFSNISFTGGEGDFMGYNVVHFLWLGAEEALPRPYEIVGGSFAVTNCNFKRAAVCLTNNADKNCTWKIGGSGAAGNSFETSVCALQQGESSGSVCEISYNKFSDASWGQILVAQGLYYDPAILSLSKFSIHHNQITMSSYSDGILLVDDSFYGDSRKLIDAVVSNNQVTLVDGMGGIYCEGLKDAVITGNRISGFGLTGIYFPCWYRLDGEVCSNNLLQGNNLQNLEASSGAGIFLGRSTNGCTVAGGAAPSTVLNRGINNILTGVNNMQGNDPGEAISQGMKVKHDLIKTIRAGIK